jgi:molybdopterin-containing oxidoreductase family iron-sulfur binding subunit
MPFAALASGQGQHGEHEPFTEAEREAIAEGERRNRERAYLGEYAKDHPKWEMSIDLSRCTGCSACVAACYAENNLPVVGEDQVQRSREMAWIRIERYYEGDTSGTDWQVAQSPMLCQHCENAPCEPVCPVYAAYHTPDGLNGQIYNRCVGTRYCANNCPYKVRYFNWWDYSTAGAPKFAWPGTLALAVNPDVTVRTKGIMEKCTFCVQRIRFAQNTARTAGRAVQDAEVQPACATTCPSEAIQFGNARDESSRVAQVKHDHRAYTVFSLLNTRPGVTYLARVVHAGAAAPAGGQH